MAAELAAEVEAAGVEVLTDSTVTGRYEDNWTAIVQRSHPIAVERLIKARAKVLVVAPGLIERPYVFAGNDKPGVMTSGAVRRFVNLHAVRPGERAVVFTANGDGDAAAADLDRVGVDVARVVDARRGENIVEAHGGARSVEGGRAGRRHDGRLRPARHRRRLDRADVAAQHGRRPPVVRRPAPGSSRRGRSTTC